MDFPTTERQTEFLQIADRLARSVYPGAPANRIAAASSHMPTSPTSRAAGLPALVVPVDLGGWGGDLLDAIMIGG